MASNPTPAAFFGAGYTETGTGTTHEIKFGTSTNTTTDDLLSELTEAEADPTTGDYRKIVFALLEMLNAKFSAATPASDRISCRRATYEDATTGNIVRTYNFTVQTTAVSLDVADEP